MYSNEIKFHYSTYIFIIFFIITIKGILIMPLIKKDHPLILFKGMNSDLLNNYINIQN